MRKNGGPFDRSLTVPIEAVLVSPQFLFRVENDPDANPTKAHRINDFELASRLSYFLWSSMPDEDLFGLAHRDELHKPDVLEAQVRRMIADPKSQALVDNFAAQWLQFRRLAGMVPDKTMFPQFDEALRADMRKETELYFAHIMRDDRSVLEFLDSDYTFRQRSLGPPVRDSECRWPGVSAGFHGRQASGRRADAIEHFAGHLESRPDEPGEAGKMDFGQFAGRPAAAAAGECAAAEGRPAGERAWHSAATDGATSGQSALCFVPQNHGPLGLRAGEFRRVGQNGGPARARLPIDAGGTLPGGRTFNGVEGLEKILLARRDQFCHCLVEKMLTYALGRAVEDYDAAAIDQIAHDAASNNYRFSSFVIGIVRSAPFQMRRGKDQK